MTTTKEENLLFTFPTKELLLSTWLARCPEVLQTLAVLVYVSQPVILGTLMWPIVLYLAYSTLWGRFALAFYLTWWYFDRDTTQADGRRRDWYRDARIWEHMRDYLSAKLVKTADLPADKNYLFAYYPHGVFPLGGALAFGTNALNFEEMYPGLEAYGCIASFIFKVPLLRELALATGALEVTKKAIEWVLGHREKGKVAVVFVGGAEEAAYCKPGSYEIILEKRKGFCKLALKHGSPIVPVFGFGETDLYELFVPNPGSSLERIQRWVKKKIGILPIIFHGSYGILPRKYPVTVIVGHPIDVEKVEHPSAEQIDDLHRKFKESLVLLFDEQKRKCLRDRETKLVIR